MTHRKVSVGDGGGDSKRGARNESAGPLDMEVRGVISERAFHALHQFLWGRGVSRPVEVSALRNAVNCGAVGDSAPVNVRARSLRLLGLTEAQHAVRVVDEAGRVQARLRPLAAADSRGQRCAMMRQPSLGGAISS
jgi:hypothetical protein